MRKKYYRVTTCILLSLMLSVTLIFSAPIATLAAETPGITNGGIYTIKNVGSNKYINVDYGLDYDNTNVYQWTQDWRVEQTFRVVYDSVQDAYRFYSMAGINGRNRVLDIVKSNGYVVSGCDVQIYKPVDAVAQYFQIISLGSGKYKIVPKSNTNVALTSYGTLNGSGTGRTPTSAGNIFVSNYTGSTNQQWIFTIAPSNNETYYANNYWSFPLANNKTISSNYGNRIMSGTTSFHNGIDIPAGAGTDIKSANNGVVIDKKDESDPNQGRGHAIMVRTNADYVYGTNTLITVCYLHMQSASTLNVGSSVTKGVTVIGKVGSTGASTGNHLHFGVTSDGSDYGRLESTTLNPFFFYPSIPSGGYTITY